MRQEFHDRRALAIMECAERGMTKASAARKLGLTSQTVAKYSKIYRIEFNPTAAGIDFEEFKQASASGISRMDAGRRFGVSYSTIHKICSETGVEFARPGKGAADEERADAMEAMYRAGKTLEEIGQLYSVSRERARQIISKYRGVQQSPRGSRDEDGLFYRGMRRRIPLYRALQALLPTGMGARQSREGSSLMYWLSLASFIALCIAIMFWLCRHALLADEETDMGWEGHSFRVTDLEPHEYRRLN